MNTVIEQIETPAARGDARQLGADADLQTILAAWQTATDRLQQTHLTLQEEVRRLTEELEIKNRQLARKNRLADLGQMASHVAHEVRNGLVPMTLYMSLLRRRVDNDSGALSIMNKVEAGFTALEATVNDLLQFTSNHDPCWQVFDLRALVAEVCESLAPQLDAQSIRVEIDIPQGTVLNADRQMLRRAVLNLALNAIDAMPEGGGITITSWCGPACLELEIADSGPGIAVESREQVFEPFYSTKSGGTGLGLAIVYRILEVHGGSVSVMNCPEGGAAFTLRFPRQSKESAA